MIGLLFEIKDQKDKKKALEEKIRALKSSVSRRKLLREIEGLIVRERKITDKLDTVRINIKCIENEMKVIDKKIDSASSKLYGFGISDCEMINISNKIEGLNQTKHNIYEELMKNMDTVRKLSARKINVRDELNLLNERLMEVNSEIDEKVIDLNRKLKKVEKNIKKIKLQLILESASQECKEALLMDDFKIIGLNGRMCGNCKIILSIEDVKDIKKGEIVICKNCKNILCEQVVENYSSEVVGGDCMKTWEMIKHLEEKPDTVFINKRLSKEKPLLTLKFIEGILSWTEDGINPYDSEFSISKMLIADEWEIKK